jgi:hypothetical protein
MTEELKAERDALAALAAQVEVFKKIREDWRGLAINDAKTLIAFIEATDATPSACLAQVRAEERRAGFIDCLQHLGYTEPERILKDYAERILQGGA